MERSLCVYGLGLFIHWGMCLVEIALNGATPRAEAIANNARHEWEDHQKICPVCKILDLEETK